MSNPFTDWTALYGPGSGAWHQELTAFNAARDSYFQQINNMLGARMQQPSAMVQGTPASTQQAQSPQRYDDPDLIGAATFWGIPEDAARAMPRDQLIGIINQQRQQSRPVENTFAERLGSAPKMLAAIPSMFAVGAGEALTGGLQKLPFIGEAMSRLQPLHEADMWLRRLEEGIRSATPDEFQTALSGANVVGNLFTMWYPATAAWKVAGVAGKILPLKWAGPIAGPLTRAAFQGGASAWLLEGGSQQAQENPGMFTLTGAAAGAGFEVGAMALQRYGPQIAAAIARVTKKFPVDFNADVRTMSQPGVRAGWVPPDMRAYSSQATEQSNRDFNAVSNVYATLIDPAATAEQKQTAQFLLDQLGQRGSNPYPEFQRGSPPPEVTQRMFPSAEIAPPANPGATIEQADGMAAQANKQSTVINSPDLALGGQLDDAAVAEADQATNPGGTNLVQGVSDPVEFVRRLTQRETVASTALRLPTGEIVSGGYSHAELMAQLQDQGKLGMDYTAPEYAQLQDGFTTSTGRFVSRSEAEAIALRAQQIQAPTGDPSLPGLHGETLELAAEKNRGKQAPLTQNVRFASRLGSPRLDAIISDQPITDEMVNQYESTGFYNSQRVTTSKGTEGIIEDITGDRALIRRPFTTTRTRVKLDNLQPTPESPGFTEVPEVYDAYKEYVGSRSAEVSAAMGGALNPDRVAAIARSSRAEYTEMFMDQVGITNPGERARVKNYLSLRYATEVANTLAPEEVAFQQAAEAHASVAEEMAPPSPERRLDEKAASKGFVAIPNGADGSVEVRDIAGVSGALNVPNNAPVRILFNSPEAAEQWVTNTHREMPDITPGSDVPIEIAGRLPTGGLHEPNLPNEHFEDALTEHALDAAQTVEQAEGAIGFTQQVQQELEQLKATNPNNWGRLQEKIGSVFGRFQPTRNRMMNLQAALANHGVNLDLFRDWDVMASARTMKQNWAHPLHDKWADILNKAGYSRPEMNSGLVTRIYELEDAAARNAAMDKAGWDVAKKQGIDEIHQFFRDLFPQTGLDPAREIARYVSHIKARQAGGFDQGLAFEYPLNEVTQPFYEHVRTGNMNLREMDIRNLGVQYVNALGFQLHQAQTWNELIPKWKDIAKNIPELKPVADTFNNWAKLLRFGYNPGNDQTLSVMHAVMKFLIPGVTREQTRQMFNDALTTTHLSLLGFRPDVWARDSIQLLLALPRAGGDLLQTMSDYASGGEEVRQAMWARALKHSGVQLGLPRIAAPGRFEEATGTMTEDMQQMQRDIAQRGWRYDIAQKVGDVMYDMMPSGLRNIQDTPFHPLYVYTKQGERMRLFTFEAGMRRGERAIAEYRAAGPEASMDQLMGASAARTFHPAVQQYFKQLVGAGADEEAAALLGRNLADATQFRYGTAEMPEIARSTGGRIAMQMGNFSTQFYQYLKEGAVASAQQWRHPEDAAKFLAVLGGVTAALHAGTRLTGWNFDKWQYWGSLTFTGGPWVQMAADALRGANAVANVTGGYGGQQALDDASNLLPGAAQNLLSYVNPLGGLVRQARAAYGAYQSPSPGAAVARNLLTGEIGPQQDVAAGLRGQLDQQGSLPPFGPLPASPVRAQAYGQALPAQQGAASASGGLPAPGQGLLPPPEVLRNVYGVSNPQRVYVKNGQWVYDSEIAGPDGRVGTHALAQAPTLLRPGQTWEERERELTTRPAAAFGSDTLATRNLGVLDSETRDRVNALTAVASAAGVGLQVGETGRTQSRQDWLFAQGRNQNLPGTQVSTWTLTSAHGPGRAVDIVASNDAGYRWLWQNAPRFGLVPMGAMDPGHVALTDSSLAATPQYPRGGQQAAGPGAGTMY